MIDYVLTLFKGGTVTNVTVNRQLPFYRRLGFSLVSTICTVRSVSDELLLLNVLICFTDLIAIARILRYYETYVGFDRKYIFIHKHKA